MAQISSEPKGSRYHDAYIFLPYSTITGAERLKVLSSEMDQAEIRLIR